MAPLRRTSVAPYCRPVTTSMPCVRRPPSSGPMTCLRPRALWEEARSFGLQAGLAHTCRDASGMGGMLTLARAGEIVTTVEWQAKACHILWLVQAVHLCMVRVVAPKLLPEITVQLSRREVEVLRCTGEGKTSGNIADILNLTERTVNFHIGKTMAKLNAVNKTAAVLRAAMLGLLS